MSSGSGQSYMDKLKAKNIPPMLRENEPTKEIPTVQISEREGFSGYRQKRASGRGTVVAPTHTHGGTNDIGIALMGARGLGDIASIIENDDESEEEKQQREARNMGSAVGLAIGAAVGIALGMSQGSDGESEQTEGEYEEEQSFDIKM